MDAGGHFGSPFSAILDDRTSLSIAFLAISDQYATSIFFYFFHKMAAGGHFGRPKITFECISRHFRSILNFFFKFVFQKWPPAAILEVRFRPFWMTENHFRSHFPKFQINTQLFFLIFFSFSKWRPAVILEVRFAPKTIKFFQYVHSYAKYEVDL